MNFDFPEARLTLDIVNELGSRFCFEPEKYSSVAAGPAWEIRVHPKAVKPEAFLRGCHGPLTIFEVTEVAGAETRVRYDEATLISWRGKGAENATRTGEDLFVDEALFVARRRCGIP